MTLHFVALRISVKIFLENYVKLLWNSALTLRTRNLWRRGVQHTLGLKQMLDFFLSQAFRPCQIFRMTPRKLFRCVSTFSVGNFWEKSIFPAFLGLKNGFLTSLKVWFGV